MHLPIVILTKTAAQQSTLYGVWTLTHSSVLWRASDGCDVAMSVYASSHLAQSASLPRQWAREESEIQSLTDLPVLWRDGDGSDMAMPIGVCSLHLSQNVPHRLIAGTLCHQAVLWPVRQVLEVEGKIVLQAPDSISSKWLVKKSGSLQHVCT